MTISKKIEKRVLEVNESDIESIISRGGKTTAESVLPDSTNKELKFTLRISSALVAEMDMSIEQETGHISRNTWILRAIKKQLGKR